MELTIMNAKSLHLRIFPKETRSIDLAVYLLTSAMMILIIGTKILLPRNWFWIAGLTTGLITISLFLVIYRRPDLLVSHEVILRRIGHVIAWLAVLLITVRKYQSTGEIVQPFLLAFLPFVILFIIARFLVMVMRYSQRSMDQSLGDRRRASGKVLEFSGLVVFQMMNRKRRRLYIAVQIAFMAVVVYLFVFLLSSHHMFQAVLMAASCVLAIQLIEWILNAEIVERKSVEGELEAAHNLQMSLMPAVDPEIAGFDISGICKPAEEVGGDYYDYLWLDEAHTKLGIAIADVSGKAMKAAMTAVMTSGMVYREVEGGASPREILTRINKPMYLKTAKMAFTAMAFAVIDIPKRTLTVSNAGQTHPLLVREGTVTEIRSPGKHLPLGAANQTSYEQETVSLQSGDIIMFYTDGLSESMNKERELFGFERIIGVLEHVPGHSSAREIVQILTTAAVEYSGAAKQYDDLTVVVVKVL